jgi:hypothetical protein
MRGKGPVNPRGPHSVALIGKPKATRGRSIPITMGGNITLLGEGFDAAICP